MVSSIKETIAPTTWNDAGGNCACTIAQPVDGGASQLIVAANTYIHDEIQQLLAEVTKIPTVRVAGVPTVVVSDGVTGVPTNTPAQQDRTMEDAMLEMQQASIADEVPTVVVSGGVAEVTLDGVAGVPTDLPAEQDRTMEEAMLEMQQAAISE